MNRDITDMVEYKSEHFDCNIDKIQWYLEDSSSISKNVSSVETGTGIILFHDVDNSPCFSADVINFDSDDFYVTSDERNQTIDNNHVSLPPKNALPLKSEIISINLVPKTGEHLKFLGTRIVLIISATF